MCIRDSDYAAFTGKTLVPGDFIEKYTSGVGELINSTKLNVFPNPFTNKISLSNSTGTEGYELLNAVGQCVWKGKNIGNNDFSSLISGVYFLKVGLSNSIQTIKLIKQL